MSTADISAMPSGLWHHALLRIFPDPLSECSLLSDRLPRRLPLLFHLWTAAAEHRSGILPKRDVILVEVFMYKCIMEYASAVVICLDYLVFILMSIATPAGISSL